MKKSVLANDLRELEYISGELSPDVIDNMTDDEILSSYASCPDCNSSIVPIEKFNQLIEESHCTDDFLDTLDNLITSEDAHAVPHEQTFFTEIHHYNLDKEQKIKDAIEIAAPGLFDVQHPEHVKNSMMIFHRAPLDFEGFEPYLYVLPNVICNANESPCVILTSLLLSDEVSLSIRFPKDGFTITQEELDLLKKQNFMFADWLSQYVTIVNNDSVFSLIKSKCELLLPESFAFIEEFNTSSLRPNEPEFINLSWYKNSDENQEEIIDRSNDFFDLKSGFFDANINAAVFHHNEERVKNIRKELKKFISHNFSYDKTRSPDGPLLTMNANAKIPANYAERKEAAQIILSRINKENEEYCAAAISFDQMHTTVSIPAELLAISNDEDLPTYNNTSIVNAVLEELDAIGRQDLCNLGVPTEILVNSDHGCLYCHIVWDKNPYKHDALAPAQNQLN